MSSLKFIKVYIGLFLLDLCEPEAGGIGTQTMIRGNICYENNLTPFSPSPLEALVCEGIFLLARSGVGWGLLGSQGKQGNASQRFGIG